MARIVTTRFAAVYPLLGIYYFVRHKEYWSLFSQRLVPLAIISIAILIILFPLTYLPQVAFLAIFHHGSGAWVNAFFLVLCEAQVIIALLFEALLVDETLVNVFDATLIRQGRAHLITPYRELDLTAHTAVESLGKPTCPAIYSPFSFRQTAEFVIFLPLNLIPIIGTPLFLLLTGARAGPFHHYRYFELLGIKGRTKREEIRKRGWSYTWFGTVALLLQLVPVFSLFFLLTTACGSALWVAGLEEQKTIIAVGIEEDEQGVYQDEPRDEIP